MILGPSNCVHINQFITRIPLVALEEETS